MPDPKRLLICTPTYSLHGGVERILQSLAARLPEHGIEVLFGLARGAHFHDPDRFRRALGIDAGVDLNGSAGTAHARRQAVRRAVLELRPELVLNARLFDTYPACAELKRAGHPLRLAVTIQAFEPEYVADLARWQDFVDLCITSGNLIAAAVRQFTRIPPERVRSIPGGVRAPLKCTELRSSGPLRILYAGRLADVQKRIFDLPRLLDELDRRGIPYECRVAGTGPDEPELRERCGARAEFLGWLSIDDLYRDVYPCADVLVHFAEWEGITIAPREAMAHGVVPVVSQFVGMAAEGEFVDGASALTFPVGDVAAAAAAIERLGRDRGLLAALSRAAAESQGGIRSEDGAAAAWASAFSDVLALPQRIGERMPDAPLDRGLLTRIGVPPQAASVLRQWFGRVQHHADPGAEWPHWSGDADPALLEAIVRFGREGGATIAAS